METNKQKPRLGIVEPLGQVPAVLNRLYKEDIDFEVVNANVKSLTVEGYEEALKNFHSNLKELKESDVDGISIMGTSLTFFRGREYNEKLIEQIENVTSLPGTTMTTAIMDALKAFEVKNIAVATAYGKEVTNLLLNVLKEYGFNPLKNEHFNISISELSRIDTDYIVKMGVKATEDTNAEVLLISCGGLNTLDATLILEDKLGIPVISSSVAGAWASAQLVGCKEKKNDSGKLLKLIG